MAIVIDLETTGLLKPDLAEIHLQPCITEIYACKFSFDDLEIKDEINTFIKPPVPISEDVTKITGITNEMVKNAPKFVEIVPRLIEFFLGETEVYAHNCSYDMGVLAVELRRLDLELRFPWPPNQICTVEKTFCINNKRMALPDLYKLATGKVLMNNHRAKVDTLALLECIRWMKKEAFI